MGLSVQERKSGIFWAISKINEIKSQIPEEKEYANLHKRIDELWPAFIGNQRNTAHWMLGSSANNAVEGENNTAWDTAIAHHIKEAMRHEHETPYAFDPFAGYLDIGGLLPGAFGKLYSMFAWTEQLAYYLRRYHDKFSAQHSTLSDVCAHIQGALFSVFVENKEFALAYVGNQVCELLYHSCYEGKPDMVAALLLEKNCHHHIQSTIMRDISCTYQGDLLKRLLVMHTDLARVRQEKRKSHPAQVQRLLYALELCGSGFNYEHEHKKVIEKVKESAWTKKEVQQVEAVLKQHCQKAKKEESPVLNELFYQDSLENMSYKD